MFALLIPVIKGENLILKSATFGNTIWFLSYAVTVLYKVPELQQISLNDAISNFIGATVWGVALGFAFGWVGSKQTKGDKKVFKVGAEPVKKPNEQVVHPVKPKKIN